MANKFRYYRVKYRRMDWKPIAAFWLLFLSLLQWCNGQLQYKMAMRHVKASQAYQSRVRQLRRRADAAEGGGGKKAKKKKKGKRGEAAAGGDAPAEEAEEAELPEVVVEGYERVEVKDLLMFRVWFLPWKVLRWAARDGAWFYKYYILGKEYEGADAEFMTRRAISISPSLWATIPAAERAKLVSKKLWIRENYLRAAGLKKGR